MRAFQVVNHDNSPEIRDVAEPIPEREQLGVEIHACALNFADLLIARGTYQDIPELPATLGLECAGVVTSLGEGVEGFAPGDRVAVYSGGAGLAEHGAFDAARAVRIPDAMPFDHAAAFLVAYGTSHLALTRRARLAGGETLAVVGATGGVGLTAIEVGKALGARVIALGRGAQKLEAARAAGADDCIDTQAQDVRAALRDLGGCDVVYDAVGGAPGEAAMRALRPEGRHLLIGFASGDMPTIKPNHLLVKNVDVMGYYWGGYLSFAPQVLTESIQELLRWYEAGTLSPHVGATFPLERADEAMAALKGGETTGKIVVTMQD